MAQAPSPSTPNADLPTIIIDPSAYEPERGSQPRTLYDNLIRLTRVTLAAGAVGGATFGVAHVLELDSLLPGVPVSALTATFSAAVENDVRPRSAQAMSPASAPARAPLPAAVVAAPAPVAADPVPAEETPEVAAAPAASASEALPQAPSAAEAPRAIAPTAAIVPAKSAARAASVQDELRGARRLLALGQLEEAEAGYRRVLNLKENAPIALTGLARVQLARGRLDDALASANRAVEGDPAAAGAHLALGDVLRARGDKAAAQVQYARAAELEAPSTPLE